MPPGQAEQHAQYVYTVHVYAYRLPVYSTCVCIQTTCMYHTYTNQALMCTYAHEHILQLALCGAVCPQTEHVVLCACVHVCLMDQLSLMTVVCADVTLHVVTVHMYSLWRWCFFLRCPHCYHSLLGDN